MSPPTNPGRHGRDTGSSTEASDTAGRSPDADHPYGHLIAPLRQRGLTCAVEFGLSDYIVQAQLPDGSALIVSPPQEPPTDHPAGFPKSWLAIRMNPAGQYEVLYDSEPGGPHEQHEGSVSHLLTALDIALDRLGVPRRGQPHHPDSSARQVPRTDGARPSGREPAKDQRSVSVRPTSAAAAPETAKPTPPTSHAASAAPTPRSSTRPRR